MIASEADIVISKAAKTVQCEKQGEAHIGNMRERCDKAVHRLSPAFVQGTSGTGH